MPKCLIVISFFYPVTQFPWTMEELNAKGVILRAMDQFRLKSCFDFKPRDDEDYYISFQKLDGCVVFSYFFGWPYCMWHSVCKCSCEIHYCAWTFRKRINVTSCNCFFPVLDVIHILDEDRRTDRSSPLDDSVMKFPPLNMRCFMLLASSTNTSDMTEMIMCPSCSRTSKQVCLRLSL